MNTNANAMINALLYFKEEGEFSSNWTRAVCRALEMSNFDDEYYFSSQSLEPSILFEVAQLTGIDLGALETLDYPAVGPMASIQWLLRELALAPHIQRLNLAFCLASIARYQLAAEVLAKVEPRKLLPEQRFLYYFARFVVGNRSASADVFEADFLKLKELIEQNVVTPRRILLAASFAIVWRAKTEAISSELDDWFVARGLAVAEQLANSTMFADQIALSGFYRAYAMIPAAVGDAPTTRALMLKAEHYAKIAEPKSRVAEVAAVDARKTVLESALKEFLYVAKDLEKAEAVGRELIALDPNWSISYHELADVLMCQERYTEALELYQKALAIGLPRVTYSQFMIGQCLEIIGREAEALAAFQSTLALDETNISAAISGFNLAKRISPSEFPGFAALIAKFDAAGQLQPEHKEMMQ